MTPPLPFIPSPYPADDVLISAGMLYIQNAAGWPTSNLDTADTHVLVTGPGVLHSVTVNTPDAGSTVELYDGTDDTGTLLASIDSATGGTYVYDAAFTAGLAVVVTGTPNITVAYRASE